MLGIPFKILKLNAQKSSLPQGAMFKIRTNHNIPPYHINPKLRITLITTT